MVNQGNKFVPAQVGMPLNAGDRIMAMDGASATLEYGNACIIHIAPDSSLTVTPECKQPVVADLQHGAGGNLDGSPTNYTPFVIGGIATLALIAVASGGGSSHSNPISP